MVETPPSAEIIKGPWKQTANTPSKIEIDEANEHAKQLVFCDEVSHACVLTILETLVQNGVDTDDSSFIRDITFVGESIKATILSTFGLQHPIQELIEYTTGFEVDPDKDDSQLDCQINHKAITDMINSYTNIMEPPDDIG
jgi:hypothetical protein